MKNLMVILAILSIQLNAIAQDPIPDSLFGVYPGITFIKNSNEPEWQEFADTIFVTDIDTITCLFSCIKGVQPFNDRFLETSYSYCLSFSTNKYFLFYSEDSIKSINDDLPAPPPSTHTTSIRFFGKRIPNSTWVGLSEIKNTIIPRIYPNPVSENLHLEFPYFSKKECNILIRNVFGEIIHHKKLKCENTIIQVSEYPSGVYFLEWNTTVEKGILKFIVN